MINMQVALGLYFNTVKKEETATKMKQYMNIFLDVKKNVSLNITKS